MKKYLHRYVPVTDWLSHYGKGDFRADAVAGLVVLFITIPQAISYAYLAGLPPETGLYAAVVSLVIYALFGSSRTLVTGPAAIIAMMTLSAGSSVAEPGSVEYSEFALRLAFLTGLILVLLRLVRFGSLVSFLSHAVVTGFITAAAILIILNQLPAIIGFPVRPQNDITESLSFLLSLNKGLNGAVMLISLASITMLLLCRKYLARMFQSLIPGTAFAESLSRLVPMLVILAGTAVTAYLRLDEQYQVAIVGAVPSGLPSVHAFDLDIEDFRQMFPTAFLIALVIFMESTSVATALASKKRERIDPNQELTGLGLANIGVSFLGGFPVAGSFGRSVINFSSGARTQVSGLVTASLVILTIWWFVPLFYYLPRGVLAAIVVVSALQLIDTGTIRRIFDFNSIDAITFSCTFLAVLFFGVEIGITAGILVSFTLLIRSSSRPRLVVVGRIGDSEHFRSVERHDARMSPGVLAIRVDESIYFVNTRFIESFILDRVAEASASRVPATGAPAAGPQEIRHVLLICTSVNFIDTSGLEMLEELCDNLSETGITLHLAEVKAPVLDKLVATGFVEHLKGKIYFTTDIAIRDLAREQVSSRI